MSYIRYLENKQHSTEGFPLACYCIDPTHPLYHMPLHWHKEIELLLIYEGEMLLTMNGTEYSVKAGELCYISEGMIHGGIPSNCIYDCLDFDLNTLLRQYPITRPLFKVLDEANTVFPVFDAGYTEFIATAKELFQIVRSRQPGWEIFSLSKFLALYGMIFSNKYYTPTTESKINMQKMFRLKSLLEYIDDNYQQEITLNSMAQKMGMSPKYFCRVFREVTNTTPVNYLNSVRIEKASALLVTGKYTVTEVAGLCGFNDSCYFSRIFKRYKNVTPKKYAASNSKLY